MRRTASISAQRWLIPVAASGAFAPGAIIETATTEPNCVGVERVALSCIGSRLPDTVEQPFYLQTTSTSLGLRAGGLESNAVMDIKTVLQTRSHLRSLALLVALASIFVLPLRGAQPLSQDDVTLLLIGGASESKMISLVEQRGVDFQLTPELIQKFQKQGATQALIDAIVSSN